MTATSVRCPFCGSERTEPMSLFGQQLLTVQYYCDGCHTPFEKVKDAMALDGFQEEPIRTPSDTDGSSRR